MKETKGVRTRRDLYNSAMELFRELGYEQVSVDQIARKAGVAKGTFYIYFKSKSDIIFAMLRQYDDYYDNVMASLDPKLTTTQKMREILRSSCRFTENVIGLDLIRVLYGQHLRRGNEYKNILNEDRALFRILSQLIRDGQKEKIYRRDLDAEDTAVLILRLIRSVFFEWCSADGRIDLEKECLGFFDLFCEGLNTN